MANETLQDHRLAEIETDIRELRQELRTVHTELMGKMDKFIEAHNDKRVDVHGTLIKHGERLDSLQRLVYGAIGTFVALEIGLVVAFVTDIIG